MIRYYFEDFQVGAVFDLGSKTITEEEMIAFAQQYDPQPFHLSVDLAKRSPFGGLIASGWQSVVIFNRLFVDAILSHAVSFASPGMDSVQWLKPVRPADVLKGRLTVMESRPSRSRPEMGVVRLKCELLNQTDEVVMMIVGTQFFGRRPKE